MAPGSSFHYEVATSNADQAGSKVTTIQCHGKLIAGETDDLTQSGKALIAQGGRIIIDLSDVNYLDSSGLGALVSLKASALSKGFCILEFVNMTPRVLDLLRITNLMQLFSS
jgi:anti-sigma B factor antagonist